MIFERVTLNARGTACLDCYVYGPDVSSEGHVARPALLIAPGGAYLTLAHHEVEPVALRFLGLGYQVFVLRYPTYLGADGSKDASSHQSAQTICAMRAMAHIREHAEQWHVDASRVSALGFSAGANVVGLMAARCGERELQELAGVSADVARPDGLVLCYPMVSAGFLIAGAPDPELLSRAILGTATPSDEELASVDLREHVSAELPRTFVWQTNADHTVSAAETTEYVLRLQRAGVPVAYHLFERGHHGMGLADHTEAAPWVDLALRWLATGTDDTCVHE